MLADCVGRGGQGGVSGKDGQQIRRHVSRRPDHQSRSLVAGKWRERGMAKLIGEKNFRRLHEGDKERFTSGYWARVIVGRV